MWVYSYISSCPSSCVSSHSPIVFIIIIFVSGLIMLIDTLSWIICFITGTFMIEIKQLQFLSYNTKIFGKH